jgi:hypothetical protein
MEEKTIAVWNKLADFISKMAYGDIIHYQDIQSITGLKRGETRYYQAISKAKKILESRGRAIQHIGGGDYQLLYPGDYSGAYVREIKIAKNHVKRGNKILKGAPVNDMSTEERRVFNDVSDFNERMQAQLMGNYVEVKRLTGKPHPLAALQK